MYYISDNKGCKTKFNRFSTQNFIIDWNLGSHLSPTLWDDGSLHLLSGLQVPFKKLSEACDKSDKTPNVVLLTETLFKVTKIVSPSKTRVTCTISEYLNFTILI